MNEHELMNALGLRKAAGAKSPATEEATGGFFRRKFNGIKDWFRKTYDPSYGLTGKKFYPSKEEKLRFLQNQRDHGGRWHTADGMNSQALFAGSDSGSRMGGSDSKDRSYYYAIIDKYKNRAEAFKAMQKGFPEYRPEEMNRGLAEAQLREKAWTMDLEEQLEDTRNIGRKMFFDNGGRWAPNIPKKQYRLFESAPRQVNPYYELTGRLYNEPNTTNLERLANRLLGYK